MVGALVVTSFSRKCLFYSLQFSPPVHIAWWAQMHCFLSVCLYISLYKKPPDRNEVMSRSGAYGMTCRYAHYAWAKMAPGWSLFGSTFFSVLNRCTPFLDVSLWYMYMLFKKSRRVHINVKLLHSRCVSFLLSFLLSQPIGPTLVLWIPNKSIWQIWFHKAANLYG